MARIAAAGDDCVYQNRVTFTAIIPGRMGPPTGLAAFPRELPIKVIRP
ncbi:MAG: hypothetical protein LC620_01245 [Halobacteriales archaeon]|nr:hypothetical protein [Halobacteriales archaeon]